jgi:hypothetical protein
MSIMNMYVGVNLSLLLLTSIDSYYNNTLGNDIDLLFYNNTKVQKRYFNSNDLLFLKLIFYRD